MGRLFVVLAMLAACHETPRNEGACQCTPNNASRIKGRDNAPVTGQTLVGLLRQHRQQVALGNPPRNIKVLDDELRFAVSNFCEPCGEWVRDRMTIEDMFPLSRLDQATRAVCLGLVLRDDTIVYGDARPSNCR